MKLRRAPAKGCCWSSGHESVAVLNLDQMPVGQQISQLPPVLGRHHLVLRRPDHQCRHLEVDQPGFACDQCEPADALDSSVINE
jgi:hypothetical protein